jgi:hypothetical protein
MAVAICRGFEESEDRAWLPRAAERFARAGFAAVTLDSPEDLDSVLGALREGRFGFSPSGIGLVGIGTAARGAVRRAAEDPAIAALVTRSGPSADEAHADGKARAPWLAVPGSSGVDEVLEAGVEWLTRHLPA